MLYMNVLLTYLLTYLCSSFGFQQMLNTCYNCGVTWKWEIFLNPVKSHLINFADGEYNCDAVDSNRSSSFHLHPHMGGATGKRKEGAAARTSVKFT